MASPVLEVRGLTKYFPVRRGLFGRGPALVKAVDGVDFVIHSGETLGLIGESGCGKTTTSKLILLQETPTAGTIAFEGRDIAGFEGRELMALEPGDVPALEGDRPGRGCFLQEDQLGGRRLAAAGLADEPEGLARVNDEVHAVHGLHQRWAASEQPAPHGEVLRQPTDFKNG